MDENCTCPICTDKWDGGKDIEDDCDEHEPRLTAEEGEALAGWAESIFRAVEPKNER